MSDQVVVVGAGPVGLITALGLARAGVEVTVLERGPTVVSSPRAAVYHSGVISGIEKLGLLDDVLKIGFKATGVDFLVYGTGERISMDMAVLQGHVPHPYNVHLGQDKLALIVLDHLLRLPGTAVHFGTTVSGLEQNEDGVTVIARTGDETRRLSADWVVGADGAGSTVRNLMGLEFEGTTWPERFVATNVRYDFAAHGFNLANMVLDPEHGAIVAKIDETGLWRCTFSEDAALPEDSLRARIDDFFRTFLPGPKSYELVEYSPYKMHQRAAETFRKGRVILAGDAAHATNPVGGLGLTTGLFDSYVLSEALAAVAHGEVGDAVLDRYSAARRKVFLEYVSPTASMLKQLVYSCTDRQTLEQEVARLRTTAGDPELQRRQMMISEPLETPSLIASP